MYSMPLSRMPSVLLRSLLLQQLTVVWRKVAHTLRLARALPVLKHESLTDELEREKELRLKVLGQEQAALGWGTRAWTRTRCC